MVRSNCFVLVLVLVWFGKCVGLLTYGGMVLRGDLYRFAGTCVSVSSKSSWFETVNRRCIVRHSCFSFAGGRVLFHGPRCLYAGRREGYWHAWHRKGSQRMLFGARP